MKPVNFEILKEKWNEYNLKDGSTLKTRIILNSVFYELVGKEKKYTFDCQQVTSVLSPNLMGKPDTTVHTLQSMKESIETQNCSYDTNSYEVNEYYLDDSSTLLINSNITNIARTSLYDKNGCRVYLVDIAGQINIKPFKSN